MAPAEIIQAILRVGQYIPVFSRLAFKNPCLTVCCQALLLKPTIRIFSPWHFGWCIMPSKVNSVCVQSLLSLLCWFISRQQWFVIKNSHLSCPYLPNPETIYAQPAVQLWGVTVWFAMLDHPTRWYKHLGKTKEIYHRDDPISFLLLWKGLCAFIFNPKPKKQTFKEGSLLSQVKSGAPKEGNFYFINRSTLLTPLCV